MLPDQIRLPTMFLRKTQPSLFSLSRRQMAKPLSSSNPRLRPIHWKASAPEALPGTLTFGAQTKLPRLPVPNLEDTFSRLKESLKPIAWSESEYASVVSKVDEFAKTKAPELQGRLLARATEHPHWLEEWWDDAAYLGYRDSVSTLYPSS